MTKSCPHCSAPVRVDPSSFRSDDDVLIDICPGCDGELVVRRRAIRFEFKVEKA